MLRIDASTKLADLDHSDIDMAIRMGDGTWPECRAELLLAQQVFPVCAPAIGAGLKTLADLANKWVISDEQHAWWTGTTGSRRPARRVETHPGASFTDPMLCLEAAIAGQGVMLAWQLLAADALADGRLVAPFGIAADSGLGYYMVTSAAKKPNRKVAAFTRWLEVEAEKTPQFGAMTESTAAF